MYNKYMWVMEVLAPLTIKKIQLYHGGEVYWGRKPQHQPARTNWQSKCCIEYTSSRI